MTIGLFEVLWVTRLSRLSPILCRRLGIRCTWQLTTWGEISDWHIAVLHIGLFVVVATLHRLS